MTLKSEVPQFLKWLILASLLAQKSLSVFKKKDMFLVLSGCSFHEHGIQAWWDQGTL